MFQLHDQSISLHPLKEFCNTSDGKVMWHTIDYNLRQIAAERKQQEMILEAEEKVMRFVSAVTELKTEKPKTKEQTADKDDTNQIENGISQESNGSNVISQVSPTFTQAMPFGLHTMCQSVF